MLCLKKSMQQKKEKLAILIDEYGGVSGMVTLEDLIEVIVGDIHEEYEEVEDGEDFEEYEDDLDDAYEEDFAEEEYEDDFDNDFSEEDFDE